MNEERIGQLERLEELRQRGALTQEEFDKAKEAILQSPGPPPPPPPPSAYQTPAMPLLAPQPIWETRDDLRRRGIMFKAYPVWLMATLSVLTFGVYAYFWLNHWHGIMPKRRPDDPSTARAIGFSFIPVFNIYWGFESLLRLCTRVDEELASAGIPDRCPRELIRWYVILNLIPYVSLVTSTVMGAVAAGMMQSRINSLALMDREWWVAEMGSSPSF